MRTILILIGIPLVVVAFAYMYVAQNANNQPLSRAEANVGWWQDVDNKPAPDFALAALNGDTLRLSDLSGKIVVLNFWATWCAPCRKETPAFVQLHEEFKDRGVQFVGVSVDEEGFEVVNSFSEEFAITYPIVIDDGTVQLQYEEITGMPTTYLINPRGQIEKYMAGAVSGERLRSVLIRMLENDLG